MKELLELLPALATKEHMGLGAESGEGEGWRGVSGSRERERDFVTRFTCFFLN